MARYCATCGHALRPSKQQPGSRSRRENTGDVLGSWRSGGRLYSRGVNDLVTSRPGDSIGRECENQTRKYRHGREAFGRTGSNQQASLLAVRNWRLIIRAAGHAIRHLGHAGSSHRWPVHRGGERPGNEPHDREDQEQPGQPSADLHGGKTITGLGLCKASKPGRSIPAPCHRGGSPRSRAAGAVLQRRARLGRNCRAPEGRWGQ